MAFIEGWPHLRGGLYEGFHCIIPSYMYLHLQTIAGCVASLYMCGGLGKRVTWDCIYY